MASRGCCCCSPRSPPSHSGLKIEKSCTAFSRKNIYCYFHFITVIYLWKHSVKTKQKFFLVKIVFGERIWLTVYLCQKYFSGSWWQPRFVQTKPSVEQFGLVSIATRLWSSVETFFPVWRKPNRVRDRKKTGNLWGLKMQPQKLNFSFVRLLSQ